MCRRYRVVLLFRGWNKSTQPGRAILPSPPQWIQPEKIPIYATSATEFCLFLPIRFLSTKRAFENKIVVDTFLAFVLQTVFKHARLMEIRW